MLKIPEDHAPYALPLEREMEALLSSVLIAGMANGSEGLDYGTLPCKVLEDPSQSLARTPRCDLWAPLSAPLHLR